MRTNVHYLHDNTIKVIFYYIFTYIFHILGIFWNYIVSRKLPGNDQEFPEFGKFPSASPVCLLSCPSSLNWVICLARLMHRGDRSVNNVKPVGFEFKIWVVDMLSVRWERGACAVALMLRADIAIENSLRTRVDVRWERGACTVALVLRADILSTTFTSARSLQSKTPYYQPPDLPCCIDLQRVGISTGVAWIAGMFHPALRQHNPVHSSLFCSDPHRSGVCWRTSTSHLPFFHSY